MLQVHGSLAWGLGGLSAICELFNKLKNFKRPKEPRGGRARASKREYSQMALPDTKERPCGRYGNQTYVIGALVVSLRGSLHPDSQLLIQLAREIQIALAAIKMFS